MTGPGESTARGVDARADEPGRSMLSLLLAHQRRSWRGGERVRVEAYLEQQPGLLSDDESVLDLIYHEVMLRAEAGESPRLEEYADRFPRWAPRIALQFAMEEGLGLEPLLLAGGGDTLPSAGQPRGTFRVPSVAGYEVLGELGRGGMGVVYKARQVRLNRLVALKMILAGDHAGPEAALRFLAEAEAVARLHHPHIVQVFAFGECDGRPYFEMEYVDGGNLAERLDGTPRPAREAARLVETLARAIHEAHLRGLVHRDLKPANILLAADGVPKIADFGLAKWLDAEAGPTRTHLIVGSPSYMAPEQAGPGPVPVGPAADVYSLGAILYELLTGRPPFQASTVLETLERVRSDEPVSPARLRPRLPRDLVTACLKCLEKDPARRYASAADLADDLRRFEAGETIRARPVRGPERLWRWCRREPAVASLALALMAGLAGVAAEWWRAETHLAEAIRQRGLAEQNAIRQVESGLRERTARLRSQARFDSAMRALRKIEEITKDAVLLREARLEGLRATLLQTALGFYRELQASLEEDASPGTRAQLSDAYTRVGRVTWELGLREESLAAYRRSLALAEQVAAAAPDDPRVRASLGKAHARIGFNFRTMGRPAEALRSYERARAIQERLALDGPPGAPRREELSWTLSNLGVIRQELGDPGEAIRLHRRAIAIHEGLARSSPDNPQHRSDLAWGCRYLGLALAGSGDRDSALGQFLQAASLLEGPARDRPLDAEFRWRLARCLDEVGRIQSLSGRPVDAARSLGRAAGIFEALVLDDPVQYAVDLVRNRLYRASARARSGDPDGAGGDLRAARELAGRSARVPREALFFDIACAYGLWSVAGLDGAIDPAEREARAGRAVAALRRAAEGGRLAADEIRRDPVLDPLRPRRDFRDLEADLAFPASPFRD